MTAKTMKGWVWVHKWSSLVCMLFLLMLCITGLPLIFYHEIEDALGNSIEGPEMAAETPHVSLDKVVDGAKAEIPGWTPMFMSWDEDHPAEVFVTMAESAGSERDNTRLLVSDMRTGDVLGEYDFRDTVMYFIFKLHVDLFAGLPGMLFLGAMGLLFIVAIVSGVVIYAPFMKRLDFGTVRKEKTTRVKWLDIHNLMGAVTIAWALVVGGTGVINTLGELVFMYWRNDQLAAMVKPYEELPPYEKLGSLQTAMDAALDAAPHMSPSFVAFPQSAFSSAHHYAVFLRGDTPLTSKLLKPALVDAKTGELTDMRDPPWYVTGLLLSQPLHFGDYGGMPLKIIWAILDIITIVVLGSGLYLWLAKRKVSVESQMAEIERMTESGPAPQAAE
ncbi:PepSY-associated TM helix [Methyloligella halotolerans]|uniref:PepSY-associated TM helix n=1 Tax=Methyloligella halotolerans TaxID=1177755 RepID=A0A1E2S2K8_9HYPH|nr:PepSY domain-containing protein [Methyloligella halotolerans]ODA68620.1 PepSY-associated TM helix [Methyloligella halotolerans]